MKLDVNVLRYLSRDDFRTLTAVEMGQKNVRQHTHRRDFLILFFTSMSILNYTDPIMFLMPIYLKGLFLISSTA
jgi:hypothetical protein